MKYCNKCQQPHWPKIGEHTKTYVKCDVCGTMDWCHTAPETLNKRVSPVPPTPKTTGVAATAG